MCAFVDLDQDYEEMNWKTWIWQNDVHKGLKWTWNMADGNIYVWMEEFQILKKWKV